MEIELADTQVPPEKRTTTSGQRKFAKDEAVLARFGKRQQLQVSVSPNIIVPQVRALVVVPSLILRSQRGFGLLPVIGLTSTLMITWEVITSSVIFVRHHAFN